jgi:hypothetical protein
MPFSETKHTLDGEQVVISDQEWSHIYSDWIKKAVENYKMKKLNCKRSETIQGNFVKGIIQDIYNSPIAIVDLTGQKPNVYYELGIRHSLRLGTIIITQDFTALPSDLKSYYCFSYRYSDKGHQYEEYYKKFETSLHRQISSLLTDTSRSDNPVSDYLDLKHYYQVQEKEKQLRILFKIINQLQFHLVFVFSKFEAETADKESSIKERKIFFTFLDFHYLDNTVSQLYNLEFDLIDELPVEELRNFYLNFRKELYNIHQYWEGTRVNMSEGNITRLMEMLESFSKKKNEFTLELKNISNRITSEVN